MKIIEQATVCSGSHVRKYKIVMTKDPLVDVFAFNFCGRICTAVPQAINHGSAFAPSSLGGISFASSVK